MLASETSSRTGAAVETTPADGCLKNWPRIRPKNFFLKSQVMSINPLVVTTAVTSKQFHCVEKVAPGRGDEAGGHPDL